MDQLERKIGVWQPAPPEARLAEADRADRPVVTASGRAGGRRAAGGRAGGAVASIRALPEHFAQAAFFDALRSRRGRVLVAEGDSWFDFPVPTRVDLLDALDQLGRPTASLAYRGDTLENMVYGTQGVDGRARGSDLERLVAMIGEVQPEAVLFSAGGNDVAGEEFRAFLNHKASGRPALREGFLREYVHEYIRAAYLKATAAVWAVAPAAKFVAHGYAHAKPTGLGVGRLFGWNLVGPWLKPSFDATGYTFAEGAGLVRRVIDEFNAMLAGLAQADGRFVYVDLRPHVGTSLDDWSDELHLNNGAVRRAAGVLNAALAAALGH